MNNWLLGGLYGLGLLSLLTALFFFATTRGALLVRALSSDSAEARDYVYPIYSNMRLIRLVDHQPVITAILLFQYRRLVGKITASIESLELTGKQVLVTSCAFGNMIPRVVGAAVNAGADRVRVLDIIPNELAHARSKLGDLAHRVDLVQGDATALQQEDATVAVNVLFFLLHEMPAHMKAKTLDESARVLAPGGKLLIAEFHRPRPWLLRALSWTYFKIFEPYGLGLWNSEDPLAYLEKSGGWSCERSTYFFENFQVITATRLATQQ